MFCRIRRRLYLIQKDPVSIIGFLATFKLAFDTNRMKKRAAKWLLPHYVNDTLSSALYSRMCFEENSSFFSALVRSVGSRSRKVLRSCPEVVNVLLKKLATDQAIADFNATIFRYAQQANMTAQQYANVSCAKSCPVADVYYEGIHNNVFIEGIDS